MGQEIKGRVVPYYSSYEFDRRPMSRVIALLLKTAGNDKYDVQTDKLSEKEVDEVYRLGRQEWYEKAKAVGLFHPLPDNEVARLYEYLYERIKEKYGEKRNFSPNHLHLPYWVRYFYFQKNNLFLLKPKEECMEIMRSMVCPVFDDIRKMFEKPTTYHNFLLLLKSHISRYYNDGEISRGEFLSLSVSAGYNPHYLRNTIIRKRILKRLQKDGVEVRIIHFAKRVENLVFHRLQERGKRFLSSSELDGIIEGFSSVVQKKIGPIVRARVRKAVAEKYFIPPTDTLVKVLEEACSLCSNGKIEKKELMEVVKKHYSLYHTRFFERASRALAAIGISVE